MNGLRTPPSLCHTMAVCPCYPMLVVRAGLPLLNLLTPLLLQSPFHFRPGGAASSLGLEWRWPSLLPAGCCLQDLSGRPQRCWALSLSPLLVCWSVAADHGALVSTAASGSGSPRPLCWLRIQPLCPSPWHCWPLSVRLHCGRFPLCRGRSAGAHCQFSRGGLALALS